MRHDVAQLGFRESKRDGDAGPKTVEGFAHLETLPSSTGARLHSGGRELPVLDATWRCGRTEKETVGEIQSKLRADSHGSFNSFYPAKRRILMAEYAKKIRRPIGVFPQTWLNKKQSSRGSRRISWVLTALRSCALDTEEQSLKESIIPREREEG